MALLADAFANDPRNGRQTLAILAAFRAGGADQAHMLIEDIVEECPEDGMGAVSRLFTGLLKVSLALTDAVAGPGGSDEFIAAAIAELAMREHTSDGG